MSPRPTLRALASRLASPRVSPRVLVAIAATLVLAPLIAYCARTYPWHALYFDHTIYQYTAWCIRHGETLYDTVAVPDGPFITWLHALIQAIAGESDRAFRWADLAIQTGGALAIGALLSPYRARLAWAFAIAALWLAQYFRYDWHWTAQREAYYALAGYTGMALLLLATRRRGRAQIALSLAGGALAGITVWGKHIGFIFIAAGLVPALLAPRGERRRGVLLALAGFGLALAIGAAALAATGSFSGFAFWYFEVPGPYRYIMGNGDFWFLLGAIDRHTTVMAGIALLAGGAAIALGYLPRRCAGLVAAPALFLIAMVLQRKGHVYQAHPVTAGSYLVFALIALHLVRRPGRAPIAGAIVMALLVGDAARELSRSWWIHPDKPTARSQLGGPHINHADLNAAGRDVAAVTRPDDRVFAYGPAGLVLYSARRRPAVAPFNNFFFNVNRAAIVELTPKQRADLAYLQREIAAASCPRLREPPAAVVVCDGADFSGGPGLSDAAEVCPELAYVKAPAFVEVGAHGCWHVYARRDRVGKP
jgi:hypothetical protein